MPSSTKQPQDHQPKKKSGKKRTRPAQEHSQAQAIPTPTDPTDKYAPNAWVSGGIGTMEDLTVPSGQLCLVRRPGLEGLIKAGVLSRMDSLTAIVQEEHVNRVKGKKGKAEESINVASLLEDPESLDQIMHVVDRVICHVVVKPEIHMTPNDVTRRVAGVVYADMVDITDKMFIFNYVMGGTREVESFRQGSREALGGVEDVEAVEGPTE